MLLRLIKRCNKVRGKVSLHALKAYVEVDEQLHAYLSLLLDANNLSSSRVGRFIPDYLNTILQKCVGLDVRLSLDVGAMLNSALDGSNNLQETVCPVTAVA
jgi:hypothetical protein